MKYTYLSEREFRSKCPYSYHLTEYAETLIPSKSNINFVTGRKSPSDENIYTATYDVISSKGEIIEQLTVSCTQLPDKTFQYELINRNEVL